MRLTAFLLSTLLAQSESGEVVADFKQRVVYVDNVKAASSSIRKFMALNNVSWVQPQCNAVHCTPCPTAACCTSSRMRSCSVAPTTDLIWFSVVRNPLEKFLSGVHEARHQSPHLRHLSADAILGQQLALPLGTFVNEHLQPNWYRLTVNASDGLPRLLNVTIKLEQYESDLKKAAAATGRTFFLDLAKFLDRSRVRTSAWVDRNDGMVPSLVQTLSPASTQLFMTSKLYGRDYDDYNYQRPPSTL